MKAGSHFSINSSFIWKAAHRHGEFDSWDKKVKPDSSAVPENVSIRNKKIYVA